MEPHNPSQKNEESLELRSDGDSEDLSDSSMLFGKTAEGLKMRSALDSNDTAGLDDSDSERTVTISSISGDLFRLNEPPSAVMADQLVGTIIDGKYGIESRLGIGGMSVVFKARDLTLGRVVALKMMPLHNVYSAQDMLRFGKEAQTISRLEHLNLVSVYDLNVNATPPYLVMEYVEGQSLSDVIAREGPLALERGISILVQVCAALRHAHERGVIHRDLKPGNILLQKCSDGSELVKVVDFGIAKVNVGTDTEAMQNVTRTGEILGSPLYMSPEQCQGKKLDIRTDIYSLGCVLYAMFTGRPPFVGDTAYDTIVLHMHEQPIAISAKCSDLPHALELDNILYKAMAKDPEQRFRTMSEFEEALKQIGSDEGLGALNFFMTLWDGVRTRAAAQKSRGISVRVVLVLLILTAGISAFALWHAYDRYSGEESLRRWPETDYEAQKAFDAGDYAKARDLFNHALRQATRSQEQERINSTLESLIDLSTATGAPGRVAALESQLRPSPAELTAGLKMYNQIGEAQQKLAQIRKDSAHLTPGSSDHPELRERLTRSLTLVVRDCRHILVRKQGFQTLSVASGPFAKRCERLLNEARDLAKIILGENDPMFGRILHNLALAFLASGDPAKALKSFQEAEKILDSSNAIPPLERVDYLDDEALFYGMQGETEKAIAALKRELELAGGIYSNSPSSGIICSELADLYNRISDGKNALSYADAAISILEKSQDDELDRMKAWLYYFKGDLERAIPAAQSALAKYEKAEERNFWDISEALVLLADCYAPNISTRKRSEPLLKRSIAIAIRMNEPYSQLRRTLKLAKLYGTMKRNSDQSLVYQQVLPLANKLYGNSQPLAEVLCELAYAQAMSGKYVDAEQNLRTALKLFEENNSGVAKKKLTMETLANVLDYLKKNGEAAALRSKAAALTN